jgi:hypothetical protein
MKKKKNLAPIPTNFIQHTSYAVYHINISRYLVTVHCSGVFRNCLWVGDQIIFRDNVKKLNVT